MLKRVRAVVNIGKSVNTMLLLQQALHSMLDVPLRMAKDWLVDAGMDYN